MVLGRFREVGNGRPVPFFLGTNGKVFISIMSPCVCQQLHRRHKHTLIWRTWTWTRPTWGAFSSYTLTLRWHEAYWKAKARQRARRQTREISQWNQKENCRERESERERNEHSCHKRIVMWERVEAEAIQYECNSLEDRAARTTMNHRRACTTAN